LAEWEPESDVTHLNEKLIGYPSYLHTSYYVKPRNYHNHQNTDPFVFGEYFHYTCCKQHKIIVNIPRKTKLRDLEPGSVILFGSHLQDNFVLDTVFVVGEKSILHDSSNYTSLRHKVSETFYDVTILPMYKHVKGCGQKELICSEPPGKVSRLYFGAMHNKPFNGMFSFFPCLPVDSYPAGFSRPIIELDFISKNMTMGFNTYQCEIEEMYKLWERVCRQIEIKGLKIGINAESPERK